MLINLVISKKHTVGISYNTRFNGAITRAFAEQHPEIAVKEEFDGFIKTKDKKHFDFSSDDITGFSAASFRRLQSGEIKEIRIKLEENKMF